MKYQNLFYSSLLAASITLASCSAIQQGSQPQPQTMAAVQLSEIGEVEGISEYRLNNGLQVLLFPDQTKETVTVNVTYRVGSKHENYGETGMAHLLEHMVFKGSPKHQDIPAELSSHGARPNGTTWTDRTNYYETFSASEENIDWALSMEADRMVNSFIAKKDLDSEMTVVRNEFESGENSAFRVTLKRLMAAAFSWHNYGKSTIGARSDLENVPIDRLQAFYKNYYQPDNATLIIAGKFEPKAMLDKVKKNFGVIAKPERELKPLYTSEPAQDGEKRVVVRRVGDAQMMISAYHVPAGSHPDYAAIDILTAILADTPRGRLHKKIVKAKLASRTYGFSFQWAEPGLLMFAAEVDKQDNLEATAKAINNLVENIKQQPITEQEVERAKRQLSKNFEQRFNSSEAIALELSEWLGMGDWRLMFLNRDRLEKVTSADVQRVAEQYLQRNNRTTGLFFPTDKPAKVDIPKVASIAAMLDGYQGRAKVAAGELFDPSFDNIDKRSKNFSLSNGIKVSLLAKKTRGESVVLNINFNQGNETALLGKGDIADAVGAMLARGSSKFNRDQLKDELDKLKSSASFYGSAVNAGVNAKSKRSELSDLLDLVAHVLNEPRFDQAEFNQYKATAKVDIEQNLQNPQSLAFNEYRRRHGNFDSNHPYYTPTFKEALDIVAALKLSDLKPFHHQFYGSSDGQITLIGDFDVPAVRQQLETLFGQQKSPTDYQRIDRAYFQLPVQDSQFDTPDKENATFVATLALPVNDSHPDAPALQLGNYIFGGGFLNSRMATRLRQQDGLSYGAGSFLRLGAKDQRTTFGAYAIFAPQNLGKVKRGFQEEMTKMLEKGFTDKEVEQAKSGLLQSSRVSRSQDNELATQLNSNLFLQRDMGWSKDYEARLAKLSAKDVQAVMRKYFSLNKFSYIVGGDLAKTK